MSANTESIARFRLGRIVATPNALNHIPNDDILCAIQRHQAGEWGEVDDHDRHANDCAVVHGGRLLSVYYSVKRGEKDNSDRLYAPRGLGESAEGHRKWSQAQEV